MAEKANHNNILHLTHYDKDYYIIDFDFKIDASVLKEEIAKLQQDPNYNGLFAIVHEQETEYISVLRQLGFHYDDTLLEYALTNGPAYCCYSKYRSYHKALTKE